MYYVKFIAPFLTRKKPSVDSGRFLISTVFVLLLISAGVGVRGTRAESIVPRYVPGDRSGAGASIDGAAPRSDAPGQSLNDYQRDRLRRFLAGTVATVDTLRLIGIQVQFSDSLMGGQPGSVREELRDSLFFANELKHVHQYYDGASRGRLVIGWDVTGKIYNLPKGMGYYGDDEMQDDRAIEMMQSVIDSSNDDIDFSLYDAVMLIHAGAGQETDVLDNSRDQLWSSFYSREDINAAFPDSTVHGLITNDSVNGEPYFLDNFMLVPESASQDGFTIGSLGIWTFEVASRLGLLPLFDSTPPGRPDSQGVGNFDLMSAGLWNGPVTPDLQVWPGFVPGFPCVFNRFLAGWVDPLLVEEDGSYQLRDFNSPSPGDTACIRIPITESEYFLVVNRVHDTNFDSLFTFSDFDSNFFPDNTDSLGGAEFDFFLTLYTNPFVMGFDPYYGDVPIPFIDTGTGMYVWHVDENVIRQAITTGYLPNDFVSRKGVDLEEADGVQDLDGRSEPFSSGSHFDSFRETNNTTFGPDTQPRTFANSGARTGITITDISETGRVMTCTISFAAPYVESKMRWLAPGTYQPPSGVDLYGSDGLEIVVFADTADVYAFFWDGTGLGFVEVDGNPETIDPYISAPGARWVGPPAFGDIDGDGDDEIIASDARGAVYAWNGDGSEVVDGDGDAATTGVLYAGSPLAAPPMLIDVDGDDVNEIVIIERINDSLYVSFLNGEGEENRASGSDFHYVWPAQVQAQSCSPPAFGALGGPESDTEGVALAWADTIDGVAGFTYFPLLFRGSSVERVPYSASWTLGVPLPTSFPAASSIAVGDLDGNGFDEAVFTLPDGRLVIYNWKGGGPDGTVQASPAAASTPLEFIELLSAHASAPALGDVDDNGTLEIALWDDEQYYLYTNNGRLYTNWPRPLRPTTLGDFPPLSFDVALTSPMIGEFNGNGPVEIFYPRADGGLHAFDASGNPVPNFPRALPSGIGATPTIVDLSGNGELNLVTLGATSSIAAVDAVSDKLVTTDVMVLSCQSLPGASATDPLFWTAYQQDLGRRGRLTETRPPEAASDPVEPGSFKIYPNPVKGGEVHARIVLNERATIRMEIFNLEGERAVEDQKDGNPTGAVRTPFDEILDVGHLKSGIYVLRMIVKTDSGSDSFVKTFAILR